MESPAVFLNQAYQELKRVTWPTRTEVINYSAVIIASVVVAAILISVVDFGLSRLVEWIAGLPHGVQ